MDSSTPLPRIIHGCMSGTSCDGIDVAAVEVVGHGWAMHARFLAGASLPYDEAKPGLSDRVRAALRQQPCSAGDLATLAHDLALAHVAALRLLASRAPAPSAVAMHGQTLYHAPPVSLQLCSPWPVAHALGVPVLYDLRGADLAAGGQGAPLTPTSDAIMHRCDERTAVVNLGGFANATILPGRREHDASTAHAGARSHAGARAHADPAPAGVEGFDICLCNQLLDCIARSRLAQPCDWDGRSAMAGTVDGARHARLASILEHQSRAGRSLGTQDESVHTATALLGDLCAADACATAVAAIADTIVERLRPFAPHHLALAGGGVRNEALRTRLIRAFPGGPPPTERAWPPEYREAAAMAILGALAQDGIPPGLAGVTGRCTQGGCCSATLPAPVLTES